MSFDVDKCLTRLRISDGNCVRPALEFSSSPAAGTGRGILPIAGFWRVAVVFCAMAMGGCTLPWQQLSLHVPPPPPARDRRKETGVPLAKMSQKHGADELVGTGHLTGQPLPRTAISATKDGVTLNIVEASIPEAAKSVLGDVLGVTYTVSDKLKGSVTIQTA